MKNTRNRLLTSLATLIVCFAMLIGSTYAWFTDTASTGVNKIQAGNLDIVLSVWDKDSSSYVEVNENTELFNIQDNSKWEPGVVTYEKFEVKNAGNLALDYTLGFLPVNVTYVGEKSLLDVIKVYSGEDNSINTTDRTNLLNSISSRESTDINGYLQNNVRLEANQSKQFTIALYWKPTANDNDYNIAGTPLKADLGIEVIAKQAPYENDSFDATYDASALYPTSAKVTVVLDGSNKTIAVAKATSTNKVNGRKPAITVEIPVGTKLQDGVTEVETTMKETSLPSGASISATINAKT